MIEHTTAGKMSLAELADGSKCQPSAILRLTAEHSPGGAYPANVAAYINGVFRGTIKVTDTTKNVGTLAATVATKTRYYLSIDGVKDASDRLLPQSRSVAALAAGAQVAGSVTVTIPAATPARAYKLIACADDTGLVAESDEQNNCKVQTAAITVQ